MKQIRLLNFRNVLLLTGVLLSSKICAQSFDDRAFGDHQQQMQRRGMLVLGGWASGNIIYSGASLGNSSGSDRSFHQMNLAWGGINLGLATLGYLHARKPSGNGYAFLLRKQQSLEKTFLFNAGLDIAYVATGFYLKERARRNDEHSDRNRGFGNSLLLQGGGLLLFDGVMYLVHRAHGRALLMAAERLQVSAAPGGISLKLLL